MKRFRELDDRDGEAATRDRWQASIRPGTSERAGGTRWPWRPPGRKLRLFVDRRLGLQVLECPPRTLRPVVNPRWTEARHPRPAGSRTCSAPPRQDDAGHGEGAALAGLCQRGDDASAYTRPGRLHSWISERACTVVGTLASDDARALRAREAALPLRLPLRLSVPARPARSQFVRSGRELAARGDARLSMEQRRVGLGHLPAAVRFVKRGSGACATPRCPSGFSC
jgi:hypothetical protein